MATDELSELWQTRLSWPRQRDFWEAFWKLARPVLGLESAEPAGRRGGAAASSSTTGRKPGRPKGSYVEEETFWHVWGMALRGASARRIDEDSKAPDFRFAYVNREKAGAIVKAVKKNRSAAQRALAGRETPPGFSATTYGIKLPKPKRA